MSLTANWSCVKDQLSQDEIEQVAKHLTRKSYAARARVFDLGDLGTSLYIIVSGRIRMIQRTEGGSEFTTSICSDDRIVGLVSAYLGVPRFLCAETVDPVELLVLSRSGLFDLMDSIPQFSRNITRILAVQASDSMRTNGLVAIESAAMNLRRVMLELAKRDHAQQAEGNGCEIRGLTQEDLATMVGVSRPWLNQMLASFERKGLIKRCKNRITITDIRTFSTGSS